MKILMGDLFLMVKMVLLLLGMNIVPAVWAQKNQAPIPVFVTPIKTDYFVDRIEALGTLKANEAVVLSATVTETVTVIHFKDGQRVRAGDVLLEMTSREEHAELDGLRSTVEEALRQYDRIRALKPSGTVTESLLDQRRREYETATSRLHAMQSRLQDRLIIAPFDGVVGIRNISVGALVKPGDVITTLDDDSVMKLDFTVPTTYLEALKPGLEITAKARALDKHLFKGTIASVNFRIDPDTRSVQVRAILPNKEKLLRPGLLMSVELYKNPRDVIVIPEEAIISEGYKHFVLVVEGDVSTSDRIKLARKKEVQLGSRRPGEVEITEGLQTGEILITHGAILARDGQEVEIKAIDEQQPLTELLKQNADQLQ